MIIKDKFESILKCPITQGELSWLTAEQLQQLNQRIQLGEIKLRNGEIYRKPLAACLQVNGKDLFYPVQDEIFCLLPECLLSGIDSEHKIQSNHQDTKSLVKNFYDDFGWNESEGVYQDALDSEDLREVSQDYILQCHLRLNKFLPKQGKYLLDVASGPVQYPAYLTYSQNYDYRICADISIQALKEAKKKLGSKGIYLLCDVTQLPLKDNMIDAAVSLHTLYHVPEQEQAKAFAELYRVLKPGGASVIVYSWGSRSLLMNLLMLPMKVMSLLKRKLISSSGGKSLYFYTHSYRWFCQEIQAKYQTQMYSWRSVNVPFLKTFIHKPLGGRSLLKLIYWLEEHAPKVMGRIGAYPLFVCKK